MSKIILEKNVNGHISSLCSRFMITSQVNKAAVDALVKRYEAAKDNISYTNMEKTVACIYMLREFGIPIKSSATYIDIDYRIVFKLFKMLKIPSYHYIQRFIDYLTRFEDDNYKRLFAETFNKVQYKLADQFITVVALHMILKKKQGDKSFSGADNMFEYSDVSISDYKRVIYKDLT